MSDRRTVNGKVVVNRSMSLDGFIAGPGDSMDWGPTRLADHAPDEVAEIAAATGAMLVGRRTSDVGDRMQAEDPGSADYPFSGPIFILTHRPPETPDPGVTYLSGDIEVAVATALEAAGGKDLEILGADVAAQCLRRGLVDEILVYVLPVLLGDGVRFSPQGLDRIDLEPISSTRAGDITILRFPRPQVIPEPARLIGFATLLGPRTTRGCGGSGQAPPSPRRDLGVDATDWALRARD